VHRSPAAAFFDHRDGLLGVGARRIAFTITVAPPAASERAIARPMLRRRP
jgi:hypothetical protein